MPFPQACRTAALIAAGAFLASPVPAAVNDVAIAVDSVDEIERIEPFLLDAEPAPCEEAGGRCTWQRVFGGDREDKASAIIGLADGGAIIAGSTQFSGGRANGLVLRVDRNGGLVWSRTLGGRASDRFTAVAAMPDGGAVLVGYTRSSGAGEADAWVVQLDDQGEMLWERTYGGPRNDRAYGLAVAPDGDMVIAGHTRSTGGGEGDAWLLRLAPDGTERWHASYGGSGDDAARSVVVRPDGSIAAAGYTASAGAGSLDVWVWQTDPEGTLLWESVIGGPGFDVGSAIISVGDGLAVIGRTTPAGIHAADGWAVGLDTGGDVVWQTRLGGADDDVALAVAPVSDGLVVSGYTTSTGAGSADAWLVGLNDEGTVRWSRTFGAGLWEMATALTVAANGDLLAAGYTTSYGAGLEDFYLLRVDSDGRF